MTHRNVLRAAVVVSALAGSCNVYDSSLLIGSEDAAGADAVGLGHGGATEAGGLGGKPFGGSAGLDDNGGLSNDGGEAGSTGEGGSALPGIGGGAGMSSAGMSSAGSGGAGGSSVTPGKGGSAGVGASAGSSGKGSSAGSSGKGGSAGAGSGAGGKTGAGGSAGAGGTVTANGCASLSVPLVATSNKARFVISLANSTNFSSATISMRVYVKAGSGGVIANYVQDSDYNLLKNSAAAALSTLAGWQTLTWNIAAQGVGSTSISLTSVARVGIEINAVPDATWSNPTLVYVDSIIVNAPALSFSFDSNGSVNTTPSIQDLSGQVLWQNAYSEDTTAGNVTLGWLASCP